jgi:hypothetical protein
VGRPEKEISGEGPIAELARALRRLRAQVGQPSYRELASGGKALYSASVLAEAAGGRRCPTWDVTKAFVSACGDDPAQWEERWEKARAAARASHSWPSREKAPATGDAAAGSGRDQSRRHIIRQPDPWQAVTAADYVRQLCALRAWAGKPGPAEIGLSARELGRARVADSTLYDALNLKRTTLPKLNIVQIIVHACSGDLSEWTAAWQAISVRKFQAENPPSTGADGQPDLGRTATHLKAAGGEEGDTRFFSPSPQVRKLRVVSDEEG